MKYNKKINSNELLLFNCTNALFEKRGKFIPTYEPNA